ncbi:MAG: zf-HC2 domain-containing protein [Clostridia bacterium]|nr:zf-HC2 domain-containing protein [Clostridia bacterium]
MKNECDILKDLLPLYADGMLSESSIAFVEEHLKTCSECADALKEFKSEKPESVSGKIDPAAVGAPIKRIKKKVARRVIIGVVATALVIFTVFALIKIFEPYTVENLESALYAREELEFAVNDIIQRFDGFRSAKLVSIRYLGDDISIIERQYDKEHTDFLLFGVTFKHRTLAEYFPGNIISCLFGHEKYRFYWYAKTESGEWEFRGAGTGP